MPLALSFAYRSKQNPNLFFSLAYAATTRLPQTLYTASF
jgi:hypothetical protein